MRRVHLDLARVPARLAFFTSSSAIYRVCVCLNATNRVDVAYVAGSNNEQQVLNEFLWSCGEHGVPNIFGIEGTIAVLVHV